MPLWGLIQSHRLWRWILDKSAGPVTAARAEIRREIPGGWLAEQAFKEPTLYAWKATCKGDEHRRQAVLPVAGQSAALLK